MAEDGANKDDFYVDVHGAAWVVIKHGFNVIAYYHLKPQNMITLEIHAQVDPDYRKEYSEETGRAILRWILDNTHYEKVICQIPFIYPNVKSFACKNGFTEEGVNRKSYIKNGAIHDQWMLGATRSEIEDFYKCLA